MFKEGITDKLFRLLKRLIPTSLFDFLAPTYHSLLAHGAAMWYRFPSRSLKVIGVTGTKGKSTTVYIIAKIFEAAGKKVAMLGSLGYKIGDREWPNTLKMTMPGRGRVQKFLAQARAAGCEYVVMEVTSEGMKQKRHLGVQFDCAVFTNLHKEHIESHGSFEAYRAVKQELFKATPSMHVINSDDPYARDFGDLSAKKKIFYGIERGDIRAEGIVAIPGGQTFTIYGTTYQIGLEGKFNIYNCLAAISVGAMYGVDLPSMKPVLESIKEIPGRMQFIQREPFTVVVDYAHTPDSLRAVYETLRRENPKSEIRNPKKDSETVSNFEIRASRLICVLGAAGGGRDKWKRPEFGRIAAEYCDEIILTNEDPYDEEPEKIIEEIFSGVQSEKRKAKSIEKIIDRGEAIKKAIADAQPGDTVIITGKGSETSIALPSGKKIPWSDAQTARAALGI